MAVMITHGPPRSWFERVTYVLLLLLGALYALAAIADLAGTARGLPADHQATFTGLARRTISGFHAAAPGAADYITLLERGYAIHELTFAILYVVIIAIPFRRGARWAWWAAWTPTLANAGYALTFGLHDPVVLVRAVAVGIALPALLLAQAPAFFPRRPRTSSIT